MESRQFQDTDEWQIGKPDLIISMPVSFTVKPKNSDWWGNFIADSGLTEDRYNQGRRNQALVRRRHPSCSPCSDRPAERRRSFRGGTLNEYAVVKNGDIYPDGAGKLIKAGARIRFNLHYHSIGEEITDRTSVAFVFYSKGYVPKHVITTVIAETKDIDIPPGADSVRSDSYYRIATPARLTAYQPHTHNRGKAQCMEAIYPNMTVEQLNCVNRYNFGWQIVYNYADDVAPLLPPAPLTEEEF